MSASDRPESEPQERGSVAAAYVRRHGAATGSPQGGSHRGESQEDSQQDHSPRDDPQQDEESKQEKLTRNWNELLQELRVTQTGVQILTGFLLTIPFTDKFSSLDDHQRTIYLTVLVGSVVTTCMILAPVAFHRTLFRQHEKSWLVRAANVCARIGLALLAIVSSGVVLFVFDVVLGITAGVIASALVFALFVGLWLGTPLFARN